MILDQDKLKINEALIKSKDLRVVSKGRSCTNCYCLPFFGIFWVAFGILMVIGATKGNPNR